jgi:hypothetical protein
MTAAAFAQYIKEYQFADGKTRVDYLAIDGKQVPLFSNEFWTSRQRQASSLHEISYRACFKPQLPRFFIEALTVPGDLVYDPFAGRGTTVIEAGLLGRRAAANDVNPLSALLARPRFFVPTADAVAKRLDAIPLSGRGRAEIDLSMFYHRRTEEEIVALRKYLLDREARGQEDRLDQWIRMLATNRLSGHSDGFFSVYTLPPNQAVTPERQIQINAKRNQVPEYKEIVPRMLRKSAALVKTLTAEEIARLARAGNSALFLCRDARSTPEIADESVKLTVTSPPFLDVVQYAKDNWLRCWFNGISAEAAGERITMAHSLGEWRRVMGDVFVELYRITAPGGWVAFEVGEVRKGRVRLDEHVVPLGTKAGFQCAGILLNVQEFTKTANIWGVRNNDCGTNTNRIVLFCKE